MYYPWLGLLQRETAYVSRRSRRSLYQISAIKRDLRKAAANPDTPFDASHFGATTRLRDSTLLV